MLGMSKLEVCRIPVSEIKPHGGGRHRTLFEVQRIYGQGFHIRGLKVCVPGWDPSKSFNISANFIDKDLRSSIEQGECFLAEVNLGATKPRGLRPTHFEQLPTKMETLKNVLDLL